MRKRTISAILAIGLVIIISLILSVTAYYKIEGVENIVAKLINNKGFSDSANKVGESTILLHVKQNNINIDNKMSGTIFTDEHGVSWGSGTAFSIGEGLFISANHVINNANVSDIKIIYNEDICTGCVLGYSSIPEIDFILLKTNFSLPSVQFVN